MHRQHWSSERRRCSPDGRWVTVAGARTVRYGAYGRYSHQQYSGSTEQALQALAGTGRRWQAQVGTGRHWHAGWANPRSQPRPISSSVTIRWQKPTLHASIPPSEIARCPHRSRFHLNHHPLRYRQPHSSTAFHSSTGLQPYHPRPPTLHGQHHLVHGSASHRLSPLSTSGRFLVSHMHRDQTNSCPTASTYMCHLP
jgi:hypothetical protein